MLNQGLLAARQRVLGGLLGHPKTTTAQLTAPAATPLETARPAPLAERSEARAGRRPGKDEAKEKGI